MDKLPTFFDSFKNVQLQNFMFTLEICNIGMVHEHEYERYLDCPMCKISTFRIEVV